MKSIILTICVICLLLPSQADEGVFDCVITAVGKDITVVCDSPSHDAACRGKEQDENCLHTTWDIPAEEWPTVRNWGKSPPQLKQPLKGRWHEGSAFETVASCDERTKAAVDRYLSQCGGYCQPPMNALTPADCRRQQSEFVKGLMK